MRKIVIYVHGKGGSAAEAEHFKPLFPGCDVIGFDYKSDTPWEAKIEFPLFFEEQRKTHGSVILIANSIGAFFAMSSLTERQVDRAFFISPVVDMKKLIENMMLWAGVDKETLKARGVIFTSFGADLSWKYYCYVCEHPLAWNVPTDILYGGRDVFTSPGEMAAFAEAQNAGLWVLEDGEHWFHTEEQLRFLDETIKRLIE